MINIVLPIAGYAKRFVEQGYRLPKPLILVGKEAMIKHAIDSLIPPKLDKSLYRLIFVVRSDHCVDYAIDDVLRKLFVDYTVEFVRVDEVTKGTLCTCLLAEQFIDNQDPLVVFTPDVCFDNDVTYSRNQQCGELSARNLSALDLQRDFVDDNCDGFLLTFKANSSAHSYVALDGDNKAARVAEKIVISSNALVGVYGFRSGELFVKYATDAVNQSMMTNGEYYLAPMYNLLIDDGLTIRTKHINKMHVLGTPEDVKFYNNHVIRYNNVKTFALCADHSGYLIKECVKDAIVDLGYEFVDFGAYTTNNSDHHDFLRPCVEHILENPQTFGIASCSTGQGFNIAANKVRGIRSVVVRDPDHVALARRHNSANFFCLPATLVRKRSLKAIIRTAVLSTFDGGRHATRIQKIELDSFFNGA